MIEFCLLWYVNCGWHGRLSWSLVSCAVTATTCAHSVFLIEQVCPMVRSRLSNINKWRVKGQTLRLRMKEPPHCATYALLPCSCSPHNDHQLTHNRHTSCHHRCCHVLNLTPTHTHSHCRTGTNIAIGVLMLVLIDTVIFIVYIIVEGVQGSLIAAWVLNGKVQLM